MKQLRWLAYFSLIYGGFLVITYLTVAYFAIWRHEFLPVFPQEERRFGNNTGNSTFVSANLSDRPFISSREPFNFAITQLFALPVLGILLTGIAFLANGYILMKYVREKEIKDTKKFVISSLLTDEEKIVYDWLVKQGGEATQKQLSLNTGFTPVKTFRILQRLENKKIIRTYPFGMTKKIIINDKVEKS